MKIRIFFLLFVFFLLPFANVPFASAEDSKIYSEGAHIGSASSCYHGGSLYLNAGQIARALGGKTDYLPASGKLIISAKRMKAIFSVDNGKVIINDQKTVFSEPLIIRSGIPFVLARCFESEDMAAAYGGHITFSSAVEGTDVQEKPAAMPDTVPAAAYSSSAANSVEPVAITALRSGNHADKTRLVIQLSSPATWQHSRSGDILMIGIPGSVPGNDVLSSAAAIKGQEILSADIASNRASDGRPFTAIAVRLSAAAGEINIFSLSGPNRIVADVYNVNASFDKNETPAAMPDAVPAAAYSSPAANSVEPAAITALRSGNHADKTRLVIQLSSPATWQHSRSGDILMIGIPESVPDNDVLSSAAAIKGQEILSADIASNRASDGRPFTAIAVRLSAAAGEINIFSLTGPNRIVADVYNVNASFDKNETPMTGSTAAGTTKKDNDNAPALPSADNSQNRSIKKVVPMPSVSEEMFIDPDIYDENTDGIVYEEDDFSSLPELVPLDSKNTVPANAQTETSVSKAKKEVNALKTKSKKGNTVKKVKSSPGNDASADIPSSVMAGLKASGLDYSSSKQTEKKSQELPQKSVSSALAVRKPQTKKTVSSAAVSGKRIIVIDPSHGGKDSGGQKKFGLSEKQYSLLLAMEIQNMFEENESFQVVLTRNDDSFMPLAKRSSMANEIKADLFISLHGDSSKGYNAKGFSVYSFSETGSDSDALETAYRENASTELESENERPSAAALAAAKAYSQKEESRRLAGIVASELARGTTLKNNGVHQANFMLLRLVEAPSIFVFAGHMTNSADKKIMDDKHSRKRIARSIYNGIMSYSDMKGWTKK